MRVACIILVSPGTSMIVIAMVVFAIPPPRIETTASASSSDGIPISVFVMNVMVLCVSCAVCDGVVVLRAATAVVLSAKAVMVAVAIAIIAIVIVMRAPVMSRLRVSRPR